MPPNRCRAADTSIRISRVTNDPDRLSVSDPQLSAPSAQSQLDFKARLASLPSLSDF